MGIPERKQREFQQREQHILDVALKALNSEGWLSATVEKIAEHAEIGKGTVYKHFSSKEEIYARLALNFFYGLLDELEKLHKADENRQVIQILNDTFMTALRYHYARPEYRCVTQYCKRLDYKEYTSGEIREEFDQMDLRFRTLFGDLFARGMTEGQIPEVKIEHLFCCMRACFEGAIDNIWNEYAGLEHQTVEEYMKVMTDFMLAGVTGLGNLRAHQLLKN